MSVLWHKVRYDLWQDRQRTFLAVMSIAAGLFAVGGIFGMVDQLLRTMDDAHRSVNPSHINLILNGFVTDDLVEEIVRGDDLADDIAAYEVLSQISIRYQTAGSDDWQPATLVVRDDYGDQLLDEMRQVEGDWPTAERFAIERLSSPYYDIAIDDEVRFEVNGQDVTLPISGVIRHPFVEPPAFGGQAHFFTDSLTDFEIEDGLYNQILVQIADYSDERARDIAADIRSELGQNGAGVAVTLYQTPDEHWGRLFVEGITLILQVIAALSLLMSLVLVLNAFTALITRQTDQIGVMKALGSKRATIIRLYLLQALVIGLLALLISLPLGLLFAWGMSVWFLDLFNIEIATFQFSRDAVLLQIALALVAPLLAALLPVLRGSSVTVREALASYGIGQDYHSGVLDRTIERIGSAFLPTLYAAALGNLFRRKGRLIFTVLTLTLAGIMFLIVTSLSDSIFLTLDREQARQQYDVQIGFNRPYNADEVDAALADNDAVESYQIWYARNAELSKDDDRLEGTTGLGIEVTAIPDDVYYQPVIVAGRWLEADDERAIVVSGDLAEINDLALGDTISVDLGSAGAEDWEIVGFYRVVYGAGFVAEAVYAPRDALLDVIGSETIQGSRLLIRTGDADLDAALATSDTIIEDLRDAEIGVNTFMTSVKLEEREFANNQFASTTSMLFSLASLIASIGAIGLSGAIGISVMERRREIGVLRSVGARSGALYRLFIMEGVLQALMSWLLAIPVAFALARPLARLMGQIILEIDLDFQFAWWAVGLWLVLAVVIAVLAAYGPSRQAANLRAYETLTYG